MVLLSVLLCAVSLSDMCLCRFKVTLLKANSLPAFATNLNFPLLENDEEWIVQGYTYVSHRLTLGTCMSFLNKVDGVTDCQELLNAQCLVLVLRLLLMDATTSDVVTC